MSLKASPDSVDTIQAREPVLGDPNAVRVLFHQRDPLVLLVADWVELGLKVGQTISEGLASQLTERADVVAGEQLARTYLTGRVRTCAQVRDYLSRKEVAETAVAGIIRRLQARGILNDSQYAAMYVEQSAERMGRRQLFAKLLRRGIAADVAREAIAQHLSSHAELTAAAAAARKYVHRRGRPQTQKDSLKMMQHLARKGFPSEIIRSVVQHVQASSTED